MHYILRRRSDNKILLSEEIKRDEWQDLGELFGKKLSDDLQLSIFDTAKRRSHTRKSAAVFYPDKTLKARVLEETFELQQNGVTFFETTASDVEFVASDRST